MISQKEFQRREFRRNAHALVSACRHAILFALFLQCWAAQGGVTDFARNLAPLDQRASHAEVFYTTCVGFAVVVIAAAARILQLNSKLEALQRDRAQLEAQVRERTQSAEKEVEERQRLGAEVQRVRRELAEATRHAGMAEVATGVLHNVGNVLNSVNVSASVLSDNLKKSKVVFVSRVAAMMKEHTEDLGRFITEDPKGQKLPLYMAELAQQLSIERTTALQELDDLNKNVGHIKEIVSMQQNYAKLAGVSSTVKVVELVEDALRMNASALTRHDVRLVREFDESLSEITVDRHKVLQILVNLVRNAKYACDDAKRPDKQMTVRVIQADKRVRISVIDNGVGIPQENLTRIFNHGFTTRKCGHGFGLHSGALAAKEMGGTLKVQSDGPGRGATFTLELPLTPPTSPQDATASK